MTIIENIFREYDIRGIVGQELTDRRWPHWGERSVRFFHRTVQSGSRSGYDARESSPRFWRTTSTAGFNRSGCDAVLIGMVPTPVLYHTVFTQNVDGGMMITGSHNPPDHNGFKICLGKQTIFGAQIQEIKHIALSGEFAQERLGNCRGSGARRILRRHRLAESKSAAAKNKSRRRCRQRNGRRHGRSRFRKA